MPFCAHCGQQVDAVSYSPCPRCGKPSNGAPPAVRPIRVPPQTGSNAAIIIVGVLIGGLIVVAILGILAAIAIPNMLTAMQRSKQKRSMADIRSIATALEASAVDNGRYPDASDVAGLEQHLTPKYIATVPKLDGWGTPMRYECWSSTNSGACDNYAVGSAGKDAVFTRNALKDYEGSGSTTNFNDDIVFTNGSFTQYPEGASP